MRIRRSSWVRIGLLATVFVAYALRTTTLTLQSMWVDEVMALHFTEGGFMETVHTIVQPSHNGPLFYLLLFFWRRLVGDSDFAVRYLSVVCSVLTMPLLFRWARRLATVRAGMAAAWLLAFSPFTLWFAQEAKMYALHMLVAVASSLALTEAFRRGRWWCWLLYAGLTSTVLYSHLFGAFLVASQTVMALLLGWRRRRRWLAYLATMLLLGLAHLPLLGIGWRLIQHYEPRDIWRGFVPLGSLLQDAVGNYFYRLSVPAVSWPAFLLPTGLALAGAVALFPRKKEQWAVAVHAFVPVLLFYIVSFHVPVYTAKYLSAVVPALFLLVAYGAETLARLWRPLGVLFLVLGGMMMGGLVRDLTDPAVQRGDWRFVAEYIDAHEGENDVVVVSAYYNTRLLERYYRGSSEVKGFTDDPYNPWPFYERQAQQYDRLWLVLHQDQAMAPNNHLRDVATAAFPVITEQYPNAGQIALIGYQMRFTYPTLPEAATPLDVCFENGLCLVGYRLDARSLPPTERLSHPPSNWIHAVLYWRREARIDPTPFRPLVRVVDEGFNVWGGNMDRRPDLLDHFPPDRWEESEVVETHFDLNLNPATPPGTYRLEVSLATEGDENRRVRVMDPVPGQPEDRFLFEQIWITQ